MLHIILATSRPEAVRHFADILSADPEVHLEWAGSGADVLDAVRTSSPHLVIIDSTLADTEPLSLVQRLLMVNAMANTALVSALSEQEFHEASEGLGILARIPIEPGGSDAAELLGKLRNVLGQTG